MTTNAQHTPWDNRIATVEKDTKGMKGTERHINQMLLTEMRFLAEGWRQAKAEDADLLAAAEAVLEFFIEYDVSQKVVSDISLRLHTAITKAKPVKGEA